MQTPLRQDFQALPPGGRETAPLREEAALPTTMESLPEAVEPAVDEGESSMGVAVVTGAPTRPALGPVVAVGAEWVAGVAEITAHLLPVATTRSSRVKGLVAGMARTGPSTTQPVPGTEVKPVARAQSMKRYPRGGGREAQRLAVRVAPVTSVTQTRRTPGNPTPRMAPIMPPSLVAAVLHLHHPEVPRPESSPPGVCPPGGVGAEAVEEVVSTEAVVVQEE